MSEQQNPKKKGSLLDLGKLARTLEPTPSATNIGDDTDLRPDDDAEIQKDVEVTSAAFKSFMTQNPKYQGEKRLSVPMYESIHAKLAAVAAAEKTDIIILANNIVDRWFKKYKEDCRKTTENSKPSF